MVEQGEPPPVLELRFGRKHLSPFFSILQKGCPVVCEKPLNVEGFLVSLPGFSGTSILDGIQTVFLDGSPLDDLKAAVLGPGSELALSSAMPGALGAVMRRGGYYASMRKDISFKDKDMASVQGPFIIKVKVFNLLLSQVGPSILEQGVLMDRDEMGSILQKMNPEGAQATWKGEPLPWEEIIPRLQSPLGRIQTIIRFFPQ